MREQDFDGAIRICQFNDYIPWSGRIEEALDSECPSAIQHAFGQKNFEFLRCLEDQCSSNSFVAKATQLIAEMIQKYGFVGRSLQDLIRSNSKLNDALIDKAIQLDQPTVTVGAIRNCVLTDSVKPRLQGILSFA